MGSKVILRRAKVDLVHIGVVFDCMHLQQQLNHGRRRHRQTAIGQIVDMIRPVVGENANVTFWGIIRSAPQGHPKRKSSSDEQDGEDL